GFSRDWSSDVCSSDLYFTGVCVSQLSSCLRLVCRSVVGRAFLLCLVPCLGGLVESFAPFTDDRFGVTHVRARFVPDGDVSGEQRNSDDAEGREADVDGLDLVLDRRQLAVREGHQVIRELANRFAFYADALAHENLLERRFGMPACGERDV